jgi:hypothetical protein
MLNIKLTTCAPDWPWARQTPAESLEWGPFRFHLDQPLERCDAWVVFESLASPDETICPPENVIFIAGEPDSVGSYQNGYIQQFYHVISGRHDLRHNRQIRHQQGHPWFVEKSYDELLAMTPIAKVRDICVISSDKAFTDGHRARLEFVAKLKARFGDRVDVWGRGIRDFERKWDVLAPYKFAIVLENYSGNDFLTEKLPDALLAYCYPIYHGCLNVGRYVSDNAFLQIDIDNPAESLEAIEQLLNSPNAYEKRISEISRARMYYLSSLQFFASLSNVLQSNLTESPAKKIRLVPNGGFPASEHVAPSVNSNGARKSTDKRIAKFLSYWRR